jgi:hypothetical protein
VAKATRNASTCAVPDRALGLQDWVDPALRNLDLPPIRALQATDLLLEGSWRGASMACLEQIAAQSASATKTALEGWPVIRMDAWDSATGSIRGLGANGTRGASADARAARVAFRQGIAPSDRQ